jgi:nucleoside-diphosphate-sugar epimerase
MRIFFAGASGVIGRHVLPLLVEAGHTVGAMTRSTAKTPQLMKAGAEAIVCDVFDQPGLIDAVRAFAPDLVLHEMTDLPDDLKDLPGDSLLNARIRTEGTRNLLDAMSGLGQVRILAQSVAWTMRSGREADAVSFLEQAVLAVDGVVLRYGFLYGPGPTPKGVFRPQHGCTSLVPRRQTLEALLAPAGVLTIVD